MLVFRGEELRRIQLQAAVRGEASLSAADKWTRHNGGFWISIDRSSTRKDRRNEMQDTGAM